MIQFVLRQGYVLCHVLIMNLQTYLQKFGISSKDFASLVGASVHAIRKWRLRARIPRREMMNKIVKATKGKVQPADWYGN